MPHSKDNVQYISFQRLPIERSRRGYMLIKFQKLIMKPLVTSGRNGIQY
ncbi:hypothetical protein HanXRQr2_Chr06g0265421 [Helianthus annuus]|uniref:Uncharacterized protein n=1 Tax=Helianthus annuus TaxID=4232 RepID=A0A9K3IU62_HELAN|nr:hypothetical protein HanXRQr2_Chr06g0265421 [Helianthus annuus]KAJ0915963.1 hypothetical protein HanPSC8_Chr06g0256031 [Helianthus annuus]